MINDYFNPVTKFKFNPYGSFSFAITIAIAISIRITITI